MREGLSKVVSDDETIVAIATPLGRSGIGVVRLSGRECLKIARLCFLPNSSNGLLHRMAVVGVWKNKEGEAIDEVVVTFFQGPKSYTGEDVLEISAHGNPLVLRSILDSVKSVGAR